MKKILIIGIFCLLSIGLFAQHMLYVPLLNSTMVPPVAGDVTFDAYVTTRPTEVLTETSTGCGWNVGIGYIEVQCATFPTMWAIGDLVHLDVIETSSGETGSGEYALVAGGFTFITTPLVLASGAVPGTGSGTSTAGEPVVIDVEPIDLAISRVLVDPDVTFDPVSGPLQCDVVVAGDPQGPHIDPPYPGNVLISYLTTFTGTTAQQIDMILSYSGFGVDLNWIGWWDGSAWVRPNAWVFNDGLEEVSFDITPTSRDGVYEFILGTDDPLPITLTNFAAEFVSNNLTIFWTTQSESSNMGWNIYRGESNTALEDNTSIQINYDLIEGAGTTSEPTNYTFQDEYQVFENNTYWYWLESVSYSNDTGIYGPISLTIPEGAIIPELPTITLLKGNYPNPFNPITTIQFDIKESETADLTIYNIKGQIVESTTFEAGAYNYEWNSKDNASGVYFYKLSSPSYSEFKKMMLLK